MVSRAEEVKDKVSIPMYFYNVIVPQVADYYSDYTIDFEARPVCKCPLHEEDTPSMRWYEETNTFYCFGCRAGGDVIQLHRKFTEKENGTYPSFHESVDFLYRYFVKGQETATAIKKASIDTEEYKSDIREVARLANYCSKLEGQLIVDPSLSEDTKRVIWRALDIMHLLNNKNMVNATSAMKYIKQVVRDNVR